MIKCVIFDLDGTLLNTLPTITYYINRMNDRYGLPHLEEARVKEFIGHGARNLVRSSLAFCKAPVDELFDEAFLSYTSDYDKAPEHLTVPYDGVTEMLNELRCRGITLAVYTNKPATCAPDVIKAAFGDMFARVVGADPAVRPLKPAPDGALEILREMGISPSECGYLGDMTVDADTAQAIGVGLTVLADWGFGERALLEAKEHTAIISRPAELVSLIDAYNGGDRI